MKIIVYHHLFHALSDHQSRPAFWTGSTLSSRWCPEVKTSQKNVETLFVVGSNLTKKKTNKQTKKHSTSLSRRNRIYIFCRLLLDEQRLLIVRDGQYSQLGSIWWKSCFDCFDHWTHSRNKHYWRMKTYYERFRGRVYRVCITVMWLWSIVATYYIPYCPS